MYPPFFITFRTYGTWLHGDHRGSVDRTHNTVATPMLAPNQWREAIEYERLKHLPTTLDDQSRGIVVRTINEVAAHRKWRLHAINVRSNHVHIVIDADVPPEKVMNDFKSWCTRRLREAGLVRSEQHVWSTHGSTRWLKTEESLRRAIEYTLNEQDHESGK